MFGYVVAERSTLSEDELQRYRGCYCGLCRKIGEEYGFFQRAALTYDMTFLILLLSSLYEPDETDANGVCVVHPFRRQAYWQTGATAYAAAMNMALVYYKCMDDWLDEKKLLSRAEAALFQRSVRQVQVQYPAQCQAIEACMEQLSMLERADCQEPDAGANAFGDLMGTLFTWRADRWTPLLRQMGQSLGRFIYLMDAVLDLPEDLKYGRYNPLRSRSEKDPLSLEAFQPLLTLLLGECTDAFERLPLLQDLSILRSILYSGVWTKFSQRLQSAKEVPHV